MRVRVKNLAWIAGFAALLCFSSRSVAAQSLHNMVSAEARVFPQFGSGIIAMREDSQGRVYVLANPGHIVEVFDAHGNRLAEIPGVNASSVHLDYAADFDLASNGSVVVADRGANSIYIFAPDGSLKAKVAVFAPTSVVALSSGQIAVTTLRTQHPIEIFDQNGRLVRGFGEPHEISNPAPDSADASPLPPLADTGRIVGDSADNLYFGILSPTDPQVKKFDRFGYAAFSTAVPFEPDLPGGVDDRFQVGFNFMRLTASSQVNSWTTLGDSGKLRFGASVGSGLARLMAENGRNAFGSNGSGTEVGTFSAETSLLQPSFGVHVGPATPQAAGTSATSGQGNTSGSGQQSPGKSGGNSATLQYFAPGTFSSSNDFSSSTSDDTGTAATPSPQTLQYQAPVTPVNDATNIVPNTLNSLTGAGANSGTSAGVGGFSNYYLASLGPRDGGYERTLRIRDFGGDFGHPLLGNSPAPGSSISPSLTLPSAAPPSGALATSPAASTGTATKPTLTRIGPSDLGFIGSLRINLDRPRPPELTSKRLTALGVDRQTQQFWAAIGSMLVHFDKYGNPMDTYYLTTPDGASLEAAAIIVEPNRLLIGSTSRGIYVFARPDKSTSAHSAPLSAAPEGSPAR